VLGIQPPDKFPLLFYRDNAADVGLTIDDVLAAPVAQSRMLLITGTGLSRDPGRSATLFAAELARRSGVSVALDIDFRPDQWHDPRAFGVAVRAALPLVDIVIGTEDEINAALLMDVGQMQLTHSQVSDTRVAGDVDAAIAAILGYGPTVLLQKRGADGARVHLLQAVGQVERIDAAGYPVEIANILGAGDAFAAGALYGHLQGWGWHKAARLGTACGAIVVTKHGCANFTPTLDEVMAFVATRGGLE
jgi:5-dehydro-2-deoxygluconokinase